MARRHAPPPTAAQLKAELDTWEAALLQGVITQTQFNADTLNLRKQYERTFRREAMAFTAQVAAEQRLAATLARIRGR